MDVAEVAVGAPVVRFGARRQRLFDAQVPAQEAITALVSFRPGESATSDEIVATVKANLSAFKAPRHVIVVDEVSRGPNGKADYAGAKRIAVERVA